MYKVFYSLLCHGQVGKGGAFHSHSVHFVSGNEERFELKSTVNKVTKNLVTKNLVTKNTVTKNTVTENLVTESAVRKNRVVKNRVPKEKTSLSRPHINLTWYPQNLHHPSTSASNYSAELQSPTKVATMENEGLSSLKNCPPPAPGNTCVFYKVCLTKLFSPLG